MYHIPGPNLKQSLFKKDTSFYFHPIQNVVWDAYWRAGFFFLMIFKILLIPSGNRFPLTMLVYPHISLGFASFLSVFQYFLVVAGELLIPLRPSIWEALPQAPWGGGGGEGGFHLLSSFPTHSEWHLLALTSQGSLLSNCLYSGSFSVCPATISTFTLITWNFPASWG